jgi:hypothetical protein
MLISSEYEFVLPQSARKLNQRSPAAGSGSDAGADAGGSQVQRVVRRQIPLLLPRGEFWRFCYMLEVDSFERLARVHSTNHAHTFGQRCLRQYVNS